MEMKTKSIDKFASYQSVGTKRSVKTYANIIPYRDLYKGLVIGPSLVNEITANQC